MQESAAVGPPRLSTRRAPQSSVCVSSNCTLAGNGMPSGSSSAVVRTRERVVMLEGEELERRRVHGDHLGLIFNIHSENKESASLDY